MSPVDEREVRAWVDGVLNRWAAVGLAVGVVRDGSLQFHGHGVADIASRTPVTEDTVFRIASITKTFTAIAVMQLWERGLLDLDAPADRYLRAYPLVPASLGFRPATVRHLLTHTAGIGELAHLSGLLQPPEFGESVPVGRPVPSLAEFYRRGVRIQAEPGTRFTYTNHGPATLGQIVEDVTGQPFHDYLREHVFDPLGMSHTDLLRSGRVRSQLATGYALRSGGARAVSDYEMVTAPAGSIYSTPRDMARYLAALLGGGTNEHGSVLKAATLATMFEPQYQPDPRIPGIGLGFFRGDVGGHPVVEHQGILSGFNSQIFVAPDDGVGVMAFTNGASRAMFWLPAEVSGLLHHLLGVPVEGIRADVPQRPETWGDICGWYSFPGPLTDARARGMTGAGVEVFVRGGGLRLRGLSPVPALYRGFRLHPDDEKDPYVFRVDVSEYGMGTIRVVFSRESGTGTTAVHLDVLPMSAYRRPAVANPRLWMPGALAAAGTAAALRRRRATRHRRAS